MATLKTNTLTGTSTAGSIAVTGEGNSTTTNLQQGLAKAWAHYDNDGTFDTRDTFNTSSLTDTAAGRCTINFSSNMSDGNYASPTSGGNAGATGTIYNLNPESQSSSNTELRGRAHGGSTTTGLSDLGFNFVAINGDLA